MVEREAHRRAMELPFPQVVSQLEDSLGAAIVAYIGHVQEARAVAQWAAATRTPAGAVQRRLRLALQVVGELETAYGRGTVQSWFQGMNPMLGDVAPGRWLREADLDKGGEEVLRAARDFVHA